MTCENLHDEVELDPEHDVRDTASSWRWSGRCKACGRRVVRNASDTGFCEPQGIAVGIAAEELRPGDIVAIPWTDDVAKRVIRRVRRPCRALPGTMAYLEYHLREACQDQLRIDAERVTVHRAKYRVIVRVQGTLKPDEAMLLANVAQGAAPAAMLTEFRYSVDMPEC